MPISNVNTTNYVPRPPKQTRADTLDRLQAKTQDKPVKSAPAHEVQKVAPSRSAEKGRHVDIKA
jgi:hypothetical protein